MGVSGVWGPWGAWSPHVTPTIVAKVPRKVGQLFVLLLSCALHATHPRMAQCLSALSQKATTPSIPPTRSLACTLSSVRRCSPENTSAALNREVRLMMARMTFSKRSSGRMSTMALGGGEAPPLSRNARMPAVAGSGAGECVGVEHCEEGLAWRIPPKAPSVHSWVARLHRWTQ